jgi:protein SMG6
MSHPILAVVYLKICQYDVFFCSRRQGNKMDENCRSLLQEHAVQLGLDMFALLAARCTSLLRSRMAAGAKNYTLEDNDSSFRDFLPGLKAWSDWMTCHVHLWNPPPLTLDPELG